MQNNIQIDKRCQLTNTWLQIQFQDDITADLGNIIPYPHHHYFKNNKPVYCWLISGWFSEPKAIAYLNDIIARFKITYIDRCKYLKHSKDSESSIKPYILKVFMEGNERGLIKLDYPEEIMELLFFMGNQILFAVNSGAPLEIVERKIKAFGEAVLKILSIPEGININFFDDLKYIKKEGE